MSRFKLLFLSALITLTGCASHLTMDQCVNMNWHQVGFEDGIAGKSMRNLQTAAQDCAKFKININKRAYNTGWKKGMKQYCTPSYETGVSDGQQGRPLSAILNRDGPCNIYGFTLNTTHYKKGRLKGLTKFCTYDHGVDIGMQGHQPTSVCPTTLRQSFMKGWKEGARQFCSNSDNAFSIGKAGTPYPSMCPAIYYRGFQSEYDRGYTIFQRIQTLQRQIKDINDDIRYKATRYDFRERDGYYRLGHNQSRRARRALYEVRHLLRERDRLNNKLFKTKIAK